MLFHFIDLVGCLAPITGVVILGNYIVLIEEDRRHIFVTLYDEFRSERRRTTRFWFVIFDDSQLLHRQRLEVGVELGQRVVDCGATITVYYVGCPLEEGVIVG